MVDHMLRFLYAFDYDDYADGARPLMVNATMYGLGEKYNIQTLKAHAKDKFLAALKAGWDIFSFPEVVKTVYSTTPASDRGLRCSLKPLFLEHKEDLREHDDFVSLINEQAGRRRTRDGHYRCLVRTQCA